MTNTKLTDEEINELALKLFYGSTFYFQSGRRAGAKTMAELLNKAACAVTELQERRKADSENLVKDRQRVIDGLCSVGETVWGIEEYMKKWDAKYLPKTSSPAPLQGSQPVSNRDELPVL